MDFKITNCLLLHDQFSLHLSLHKGHIRAMTLFGLISSNCRHDTLNKDDYELDCYHHELMMDNMMIITRIMITTNLSIYEVYIVSWT